MWAGDVSTRMGFMVGGQEQLTLGVRTSTGGAETDAFNTTIVLTNVRRFPVKQKDLLKLGGNFGENWFLFQVFDLAEGSLPDYPIVGYILTDANSVIYEVRVVDSNTIQGVYQIYALQDA